MAKKVGIVTPDLARVKFLLNTLETSQEFEPVTVISSDWKEGNIFDFGQLFARSEVIYFDGISPALAFFSKIKVDKKCILRLYGPEITVDSTRTLPWNRTLKTIVVNPYYFDKYGAQFRNSIQVPINMLKVSRPETPYIENPNFNLNWESKRFAIFHNISPEFDLLPLVDILKNNPDFSCSIVGKKLSDSYLDLINYELDRNSIKRDRVELYPDLPQDVMTDFIEEHPRVISLRPDEAVFYNLRELVAVGCKPYIRRTAISSGMFPEDMTYELSDIKFDTEAYQLDRKGFCETGEKDITLTAIREA